MKFDICVDCRPTCQIRVYHRIVDALIANFNRKRILYEKHAVIAVS